MVSPGVIMPRLALCSSARVRSKSAGSVPQMVFDITLWFEKMGEFGVQGLVWSTWTPSDGHVVAISAPRRAIDHERG